MAFCKQISPLTVLVLLAKLSAWKNVAKFNLFTSCNVCRTILSFAHQTYLDAAGRRTCKKAVFSSLNFGHQGLATETTNQGKLGATASPGEAADAAGAADAAPGCGRGALVASPALSEDGPRQTSPASGSR